MNKHHRLILLAGFITGLAALGLAAAGNPANMGFCIACFLRDIAGGLGMHSAAKVQYIRPEIIGLVLGALLSAMAGREFKARAGSAPALRFVLGMIVMVGALAFLGCPLRMVLRLAGGDLTAVSGFAGFALGIGAGGLIVGVLAQKSRLCMAGGIRDVFLFRDFHLVSGFAAIFATVLIGNLLLGGFHPTLAVQPVAHHDYLWSLLGMASVGWGAVLLGGCPLRQLILAGEGNGDSAVTVFGMLTGAALAHNFGMAGNADAMTDGAFVAGGVGTSGQIGILTGLILLFIISVANLHKEEKNNG